MGRLILFIVQLWLIVLLLLPAIYVTYMVWMFSTGQFH